jgi:hypothetical protein
MRHMPISYQGLTYLALVPTLVAALAAAVDAAAGAIAVATHRGGFGVSAQARGIERRCRVAARPPRAAYVP